VVELLAREAQGRLQRVFRDFIRAVATAAHPLVIFLDDLQWADGATPQLLVHLLGDEELSHLLVIGAYRDNEVGPGHLLHSALLELGDKRPDAIRQIQLAPLSEAGLNRLVADTLRVDPASCGSLSNVLFLKTAGNPFFSNELLGVLHREGALWFASNQGRWVWRRQDCGRCGQRKRRRLLVLRMQNLSTEALHCLRSRLVWATNSSSPCLRALPTEQRRK